MTAWTKTSERLPEVRCDVLIWYCGSIYVVQRVEGRSEKPWQWWDGGTLFIDPEEVFYWMEAPPPPNEE